MTRNVINGLGAVIFGCVYLVMTMRLPHLQVGDSLGPKVFPLMVGGLLTLLGAVLLFKEMLLPKEQRKTISLQMPADVRVVVVRMALTSFFGIAYGFLLDPLGYLLSTTIFMLALMFMVNKLSRWLENIAVSVGFSVVTYAGFATLLHLSLPRGIVYF